MIQCSKLLLSIYYQMYDTRSVPVYSVLNLSIVSLKNKRGPQFLFLLFFFPCSSFWVTRSYSSFQELCETHSTAQCHPYFATQLCCLFEAEKLAMVAPLHKSQAFAWGKLQISFHTIESQKFYFNFIFQQNHWAISKESKSLFKSQIQLH